MLRTKAIPGRMTSCLVCGVRDQCLLVSHLWGVRHSPERLKQVVDEIRYNRSMIETTELRRGRVAHELLEKEGLLRRTSE